PDPYRLPFAVCGDRALAILSGRQLRQREVTAAFEESAEEKIVLERFHVFGEARHRLASATQGLFQIRGDTLDRSLLRLQAVERVASLGNNLSDAVRNFIGAFGDARDLPIELVVFHQLSERALAVPNGVGDRGDIARDPRAG